MAVARAVLGVLAPDVELEEHLFGAAAIRAHGRPAPGGDARGLPGRRTRCCKAPIGDPEFDAADVRPEQGLMRLRAELDVYANLRPARQGDVDLLIVRELVGGLYFGARGVREDGTVFDTCEYHPSQVERIARRAFELARTRSSRLASVDKANVLDTSRMWRRVVAEVAADYPDVEVEDMLVDNAAMQLASSPERFDVIVTENMFGDILSDVAAAMTGGLGLAPSASLGDAGPGIFEPVHGSAPDIAGRGIANPAAMLRSTALLLEHALGRPDEARALDEAVDDGARDCADAGSRRQLDDRGRCGGRPAQALRLAPHVDREHADGVERDLDARLPGLIHVPEIDPAVLLREPVGELVVVVRLDPCAGSDLEVALRNLAIEDEQRALGTLAEVLRLRPRRVEAQLQLAVHDVEPEHRHLREAVIADRRQRGNIDVEQVAVRVGDVEHGRSFPDAVDGGYALP